MIQIKEIIEEWNFSSGSMESDSSYIDKITELVFKQDTEEVEMLKKYSMSDKEKLSNIWILMNKSKKETNELEIIKQIILN